LIAPKAACRCAKRAFLIAEGVAPQNDPSFAQPGQAAIFPPRWQTLILKNGTLQNLA
jgi:hypothetical protein